MNERKRRGPFLRTVASAGGRATALAGSQVIGAALPLERRSREGGFSGGGDLGEVSDLEGGGGGGGLKLGVGVGVGGQRGDEGATGR